MSPALFVFSYFSDRAFCFCLGLALDGDPPTYASCVAGYRCVSPHPDPRLFVEMGGLTNFLPRLTSNHHHPNLDLLSPWNYRSMESYPDGITLLVTSLRVDFRAVVLSWGSFALQIFGNNCRDILGCHTGGWFVHLAD
jgi:hypothetical protein